MYDLSNGGINLCGSVNDIAAMKEPRSTSVSKYSMYYVQS